MLGSMSASPADRQQQAGAPLRRLLPAGPPVNALHQARPCLNNNAAASRPPPAPAPAPSPGTAPSVVPGRRKRGQATAAACGACRKRKSKCDGQRPTCSICRDRGTACEFDTNAAETHTQALKCKYHELQSQKSAFEQIYDVLQMRPENEAEEVFRRIRRGADASSILRHVNYGDMLVQMALVPEARYRFEFPYLPDIPPFLRRPDNPYLDSEVYECALRGPASPSQQQQGPYPTYLLLPDTGDGAYADGQRDPYLKPYLSATVVHPWLDSVRPSRYTTVSDDDPLMRKLLHDYLLFEYDWFTLFHKDNFLDDMAAEKPRFCSQLLVNTILCLGCFCHRELYGRAEPWNPKTLGYQFLAEAKRLFELEAESERPFRAPADSDSDWERKSREWEHRTLTTIQSAALLNVIYNLNGADKIGWRFTKRAIELANEIRLFGPPLKHHGPEMQCVRTYTAWGLFCWQSLSSYHYLQPPLVKEPPLTPLPDPLEQPQWYGELWVKFPLSQSRLPTHHGLMFKAKADFWVIVNDFMLLAFFDRRAPSKLSVCQIYAFYNRMRAWIDGLPASLTPKKIVLPHQLKLHMHYHLILIDLFRPILSYTAYDGVQRTKMPRDIYSEAATHLETLIRLYYLRHGFEALDCFLIHFLGTLSHMTMDAVASSTDCSLLESRRSTLLLLTKGMHDQSRSFFVAKAVFRLQVSLMRPQDVDLLKRFVEIGADELIYGPLEHVVRSDWPVYEVGLEAKAEHFRQGKSLASSLASLSLQSGTSHPPPCPPT